MNENNEEDTIENSNKAKDWWDKHKNVIIPALVLYLYYCGSYRSRN